ncbi:MAG: Holliday junction resolvase RuvX [Coriobacteriales bacterium]|jgi:putative Holliday junction resolvase|nr:Holliday junction resolvase RuvX [Coriobacteriales bacterium]
MADSRDTAGAEEKGALYKVTPLVGTAAIWPDGRARGRILALDLGDARIGLALSDDHRRVATPLKVVPAVRKQRDPELARVVSDYEITLLVFGLPLSLDGEEHAQARHIRAQAQEIADKLELDYDFIDERLSSAEAHHLSGRPRIDDLAAALFLQAYLDQAQREQTE